MTPEQCLAKRHDLLAAARSAEQAGDSAIASRAKCLASNLEMMGSADAAVRERGATLSPEFQEWVKDAEAPRAENIAVIDHNGAAPTLREI